MQRFSRHKPLYYLSYTYEEYFCGLHRTSQVVQWSRICLPVQETRETQIRSLSWEDSPGGGNSNPLQCSCLENSMDRGDWQVTSLCNLGVAKSWTRLTTHTHLGFRVCSLLLTSAVICKLQKRRKCSHDGIGFLTSPRGKVQSLWNCLDSDSEKAFSGTLPVLVKLTRSLSYLSIFGSPLNNSADRGT